MTIHDTARFLYPSFAPDGTASIASTDNVTLSASIPKYAAIIHAPASGVITAIHVYITSITTPGICDFRLETVDPNTGLPTGTLWDADTNAAINLTSTGALRVGIFGLAFVTAGDSIAVVFERQSGEYRLQAPRFYIETAFPYRALHNGTNWTVAVNGRSTIDFALEYGDGNAYFVPGLYGAAELDSLQFNSDSSPDERGNRFTLPIGMRASGAWVYSDDSAPFDVVIYDSSNAQVASLSYDNNLSGSQFGLRYLLFDAPITLNAEAQYRIIIKPTTTTNVTIFEWDALRVGSFPSGDRFQRTTRTDGGSWTDSSDAFVHVGLLIDGIDVPDGGGISRARVVNA